MGTYYDPLWIVTGFLGWKRGASKKVTALKVGLNRGMLFIDTAEIYQSEPLVAEAIRGRKRDELFLATKVWWNHLHHDDVVKSLERSLRRLDTSYIDLYQVHTPNGRVPIRETMSAMEELVGQGKVLAIGVSNFSLEQVKEAQASLSKSQLASIQMPYNLMNRTIERDLLPYCDKESIAVMAYFPLAHGRLAPSDPAIAELSAKYSKTRSQLALRWLAQKKNVFPIPRASDPQHVQLNSEVSGWGLAPEDTARLEALYRKE
jgi:diketogulonate reductase-like aldo/keto reductase